MTSSSSSSSSSLVNKSFLTLKDTSYYRVKFARRFLHSFMKIKRKNSDEKTNTCSSSSSKEIRKRSDRIKLAAYASMARTIGPRKAWARALLFKLRRRKRSRFVFGKRQILGLKIKRNRINKKRKRCLSSSAYKTEMLSKRESIEEKTEKLREIVPGGKDMDICGLFEETAHFIKCLSMQVQVMQDFADRLSK